MIGTLKHTNSTLKDMNSTLTNKNAELTGENSKQSRELIKLNNDRSILKMTLDEKKLNVTHAAQSRSVCAWENDVHVERRPLY